MSRFLLALSRTDSGRKLLVHHGLQSRCRLWLDEFSIELFCESMVDVHETSAVTSWTIGSRVPLSVRDRLIEWGGNGRKPAVLKHLLPGLFLFGAVYKDTGRVVLITDRVNLNRAYLHTAPEGSVITSHPTNLDLGSFSLNEAAIASYLANGSMIGDLTLFNELRLLEPASVYTFVRGKPKSKEAYWNFLCGGTPHFNRAKAKQDLKDAITESLRRCCDSERIVLSLSGGYDSSVILGFLKDVLQVRDVLCVSYVNGTPAEHSDAAVAAQQAAICGYPHWVRQSYAGSAFQVIQRNAMLGEGVNYFCEEIDYWCGLFKELEVPSDHVLVAGEECFGGTGRRLDSPQGALRPSGITDFAAAESLKPYLGSNLYHRWGGLLAQEMRRLLPADLEEYDLHDLRDEIYLRHRIPHRLLPWRRYIIGSAMPVRTPFLDGDILDLVSTWPVEERRGKRLFKELGPEAFPKIFAVPRAYHGQGNVPDWAVELAKEKAIFETWIKGTPSLLDNVIGPEQQLSIFQRALEAHGTSNRFSAKERVRNALFNLGLRKYWDRLKMCTKKTSGTIPMSQLAVRLLTMRAFLSEPVMTSSLSTSGSQMRSG